jgi:hypothetical protein
MQSLKAFSDSTSRTLSVAFTFQCYEYYYHDLPEVYAKTSELARRLQEYNEAWKNDGLSNKRSLRENWINDMKSQISRYLKP